MNVLKRAFWYTTRKRGKSLTLLLLCTLITTFVTLSFSVLSATRAAASSLRETVGASFSLQGNLKDLENEADSYTAEYFPILQQSIDAIAGHGGMKAYNAQQSAEVFANGFYYTSGMPSGAVKANTATEWNRNFMDGTLTLAQGRHLLPADRTAALVSRELAEENNLIIGDSLTLHSEPDGAGTFISVKIVGIYEADPAMEFDKDTIFTSHDAFWNLTEKPEGSYAGKVDFFVADPAELQNVVNAVQNIASIPWDEITLHTDAAEYNAIAYQLSAIGRLTFILIIATTIVSAIILLLILTMRIKGRVHEVGMLLAVGVRKSHILVQFLLEIIVILFLAFLLSAAISSFLAVQVESYLKALVGAVRVSIPAGRLFLQYAAQTLLVVAGVMIAAYPMIRLNPKEVLSKMS